MLRDLQKLRKAAQDALADYQNSKSSGVKADVKVTFGSANTEKKEPNDGPEVSDQNTINQVIRDGAPQVAPDNNPDNDVEAALLAAALAMSLETRDPETTITNESEGVHDHLVDVQLDGALWSGSRIQVLPLDDVDKDGEVMKLSELTGQNGQIVEKSDDQTVEVFRDLLKKPRSDFWTVVFDENDAPKWLEEFDYVFPVPEENIFIANKKTFLETPSLSSSVMRDTRPFKKWWDANFTKDKLQTTEFFQSFKKDISDDTVGNLECASQGVPLRRARKSLFSVSQLPFAIKQGSLVRVSAQGMWYDELHGVVEHIDEISALGTNDVYWAVKIDESQIMTDLARTRLADTKYKISVRQGKLTLELDASEWTTNVKPANVYRLMENDAAKYKDVYEAAIVSALRKIPEPLHSKPRSAVPTAFTTLTESNGHTQAREALDALTKIVNNIIQHPKDAKYKKLKKNNKVLNQKILGLTGGLQCLYEIGFRDEGPVFLFEGDPMQKLPTICLTLSGIVSDLFDKEQLLNKSGSTNELSNTESSPFDVLNFFDKFSHEVESTDFSAEHQHKLKADFAIDHTDAVFGKDIMANKFKDFSKLPSDKTVPLQMSFFWACEIGRSQYVKKLVDHTGISVNYLEVSGLNPLLIACRNCHVDVVQILLDHEDIIVNQADASDCPPLYSAAREGHASVVQSLLTHKNINVNYADSMFGATALMIATYSGHLEIVRSMLNHRNVAVNFENGSGQTALCMAQIHKKDTRILQELLKHPKIDTKYVYDMPAFMVASHQGYAGVVDSILNDQSIDVNMQHTNGQTALFFATANGHNAIVKRLLRHPQIDVNLANVDVALQNNHSEVVKIFRRHPEIATEKFGAVSDSIPLPDMCDLRVHDDQASAGHGENDFGSDAGEVTDIDFIGESGHDDLADGVERMADLESLRDSVEGCDSSIGDLDDNSFENGNDTISLATTDSCPPINLPKKDAGHDDFWDPEEETMTVSESGITAPWQSEGDLVEGTLAMEPKLNISDCVSRVTFYSSIGLWDVLHKLLLDLEPEFAKDQSMKTRTLWFAMRTALENSQTEIVKIQKDHHDVCVNYLHDFEAGHLAAALHVACHKEQSESLRTLLNFEGIDVNLKDQIGCTGNSALFDTFNSLTEHPNDEQNFVKIVQMLLDHGIDVNRKRHEGSTAIMGALCLRRTDVLQLFLQHKDVDVNATMNSTSGTINGTNVLYYACASGLSEEVDLLLQHPRIDVNKGVHYEDLDVIVKAGTTREGHHRIAQMLSAYESNAGSVSMDVDDAYPSCSSKTFDDRLYIEQIGNDYDADLAKALALSLHDSMNNGHDKVDDNNDANALESSAFSSEIGGDNEVDDSDENDDLLEAIKLSMQGIDQNDGTDESTCKQNTETDLTSEVGEDDADDVSEIGNVSVAGSSVWSLDSGPSLSRYRVAESRNGSTSAQDREKEI
eukprot:gene541-296_t